MNKQSGQIYRGDEEIEAARARGEVLVMLTENQVKAIEWGKIHNNRHWRRTEAAGVKIRCDAQRKRRKRGRK